MAPDSRGTVRLASADPAAPPLIDPGLLRDGRDLERLHARLAMARGAADAAFARLGITEMAPGRSVRDPPGCGPGSARESELLAPGGDLPDRC